MGERFKVLLLRKGVAGPSCPARTFAIGCERAFEPVHRIGAAALLRSPRPHSLEVLSMRSRRLLELAARRCCGARGGSRHCAIDARPTTPAPAGCSGSVPRPTRTTATACSARCTSASARAPGSRSSAGKSSSPADRADIEADTLVDRRRSSVRQGRLHARSGAMGRLGRARDDRISRARSTSIASVGASASATRRATSRSRSR